MTVKMAIFTGDIYHILENLRKDCPIGQTGSSYFNYKNKNKLYTRIIQRVMFWKIHYY